MQETLIASPEERAAEISEKFKEWFSAIISEYGIVQSKYSTTHLDASRIAYLCSKQLIIIFKKPLGQDAAYQFYYWALKKKLRCQKPVFEREYTPGGKKRKFPNYPALHHRIFDGISFYRFISIADELVTPKRLPLIRRDPVIRLREPKKLNRF